MKTTLNKIISPLIDIKTEIAIAKHEYCHHIILKKKNKHVRKNYNEDVMFTGYIVESI